MSDSGLTFELFLRVTARSHGQRTDKLLEINGAVLVVGDEIERGASQMKTKEDRDKRQLKVQLWAPPCPGQKWQRRIRRTCSDRHKGKTACKSCRIPK